MEPRYIYRSRILHGFDLRASLIWWEAIFRGIARLACFSEPPMAWIFDSITTSVQGSHRIPDSCWFALIPRVNCEFRQWPDDSRGGPRAIGSQTGEGTELRTWCEGIFLRGKVCTWPNVGVRVRVMNLWASNKWFYTVFGQLFMHGNALKIVIAVKC